MAFNKFRSDQNAWKWKAVKLLNPLYENNRMSYWYLLSCFLVALIFHVHFLGIRRNISLRSRTWNIEENREIFSFSPVPPKVQLHLGSTLNAENIKEGDDVYFECKVRANPEHHKITWRHNVSSTVSNELTLIPECLPPRGWRLTLKISIRCSRFGTSHQTVSEFQKKVLTIKREKHTQGPEKYGMPELYISIRTRIGNGFFKDR